MRRAIPLLVCLFACQFLYAQGVNFDWAKDFRGGTTLSHAMVVDASGNVYTTGEFTGTIDFDPGPGVFNLTQQPSNTGAGTSGYVLKLDANGNFVWVHQFVSLNITCTSIALDPSGNIYVAGQYQHIAYFDQGVSPPQLTHVNGEGSNVFICKLANDGSYIWAKDFGGTDDISAEATAIAVDPNGNVYTTGVFYGPVDFNPGNDVFNMTTVSLNDIFISKLDTDGNFVWAQRIGGPHTETSRSMCLDQSNNIYITGYYTDRTDFDPGPATTIIPSYSTVADAFVVKLNNAGGLLWISRIGAGGNAYTLGRGVAVDHSDNVYVTGYYDLACDFDPDLINEYNVTSVSGSEDMFLVKLDSRGQFLWGKSMGGPLDDRAETVHIDDAGYIYITGNFSSTADFDPGSQTFTMTSGSENDVFISKLTTDGDFVWAKQFRGSNGTNAGLDLTTDAAFNVYTTGTYVNTVDFDPGVGTYNLSATGTPSAFVHKMGRCQNTTSHTITASACGSYLLNNQVYTSSGTYMQTLTNTANCDSLIYLMLTISSSNTTIADTTCTAYTWQGQTYTASGHYTAMFTTVAGCDSILNLDLTVAPPPVNFLKSIDSICEDQPLTILPLHNYSSYEWSTGSTAPSITINAPGLYELTVKDSNNCTGSSRISILSGVCYPDIMIPSAFTPNGDQLNDIFKPTTNHPIASFKMEVYNRTGQLVFRSTDPQKGWNGMVNGVTVSTAVFVWQCMYQLEGQEKKFKKGTVALIR